MPGRIVLPFLLLAVASAAYEDAGWPPIGRRSFPEGFVFGTASSAYQYEGGAMDGGRGPSIWDTFTRRHPEKIADRSNGDVADDSYHLYKHEDVRLMKDMGMDAYRFSISWTRILPSGALKGGVNMEGIKYYNNLINELMSKGLQPFVTLFHWDSPPTLEDKYGGFLNPNIMYTEIIILPDCIRNDYKDYAGVCFREFGDRVKHWITLNEPTMFSVSGYASGTSVPGRCSPWEQGRCSVGDSGREPYIAGHHLLLAHATTVRLYKEKYQGVQKGEIGITLVSNSYVPFSPSNTDSDAAIRAIDFGLGWFMDPPTRGDYPRSMRGLVGNRLPRFSKEQSELLKGAFDFIGLNYYTSTYAGNIPPSNGLKNSYNTDARANLTSVRNGVPIGPRAASPWLYVYPRGFRELLLYIKDNYGNPTIYITENGVDEVNNKSLPLHEALKDYDRIEYHHSPQAPSCPDDCNKVDQSRVYTLTLDGANVKGYFAWSLLDNFEWSSGYTVRFGLNFVDFNDGLKRYPKQSAHWFKKFLKR